MRLPYADQATVPEGKLVDYLLNVDHPAGQAKARFFLMLGFRREQPEPLRAALLGLAATAEMTETTTVFGRKFVGFGEIRTPSGRVVEIVTVWFLSGGQPPPRLVTAYPAD
jgi:hypothetical protein